MLINHMAQGFSFESFAATIDCHRDTLYEWRNVHEEFSDAYKRGNEKRLLLLESIGNKGMLVYCASKAGLPQLPCLGKNNP